MKRQLVRVLFVHVLILIPWVGALADSPAQAQQKPTKAVQPLVADAIGAEEMDKAYHEQMKNGNLMIGRISLALMALEHGMLDAAGKDADEALKLARILEKNVPEFRYKDTMRFGKLTHEEESVTRVFYIPVADETFMVHGFDRPDSKGEKIRETDARMVHVHVTLDVRKAISGLMDANAAMKKKDAKAAERALSGILSAAVTDEVVIGNPLHIVHDNLILAENLLREKHYDGARFALKYAKKGLGDYESRLHDSGQKKHVTQMQKDIDAFSEQLRKDDPTVLQKAAATVKGWGKNVKKWLTHPAPSHQPEHSAWPTQKDSKPETKTQ